MSFAISCTDDLIAKLSGIELLDKKTLTVYSMEDLLETLANVRKPAVGVLYEGARKVQAAGASQIGVSGEAVFSLLMVYETSVMSKRVDAKSPAHDLLDQMRGEIHGSRSPTGHFWSWVLEAPASQKANVTVWLQRWSTPVQLSPSKRQ